MVVLQKDSWNGQYAQEAVRKTLLDLLFYIFFLVIVSIISYGSAGSSTYYMADMLHKKLVGHPFDLNQADASTQKVDECTFLDVTTPREFWSFLQIVLLPALYEDDGGDAASPNRRKRRQQLPIKKSADLFLQTENLLLGPPRLRQLRVRNGSCTVHKLFVSKFRDCYGAFSVAHEERMPFGSGGGNGTAWTHASSTQLGGGVFHWGIVGAYPGGGYHQDLVADAADSAQIVSQLQQQHWIDRATRAVLVEFSIYNANMNLFCVAKLIAEFPATGGVLPSFSFPTVKLLGFVTFFDYVVLLCEIVFLVQVVYFTVVEVCELIRERWSYFLSFWNIIDLTIVVISYTTLGFSAYRYLHTWNIFPESASTDAASGAPLTHFNMDRIAFWQVQYNTAMALCVFMVWVKVFKYMSFNKTMLQLSTTLSRCAKDLLAFGLMFLIVFVAYAQLGYILFGTENPDFRTYADSVLTLLRTVLGDFDYLAIERSNRILGPIYFITYIFFVFFVLLNMFLAIINDTYSDVKSLDNLQKVFVGPFVRKELAVFKRCVQRAWRRLCCREALLPERPDTARSLEASGGGAGIEDAVRAASREVLVATMDLSFNRSSPQTLVVERRKNLHLKDIFEPLGSEDASILELRILALSKRMTVLEQTMDTIVVRLNDFIDRVDSLAPEHNESII